MDYTEFKRVMEAKGCKTSGNYFCNSIEGIPFTIIFGKGNTEKKTKADLQIRVMGKVKTKILGEMCAHNKKNVYVAMYEKTLVGFTIEGNTREEFEAALDGLIESIPAGLRKDGVLLPTNCPVCGVGNCDSYAYWQNGYLPVHRGCINSAVTSKIQNAEKNLSQGSYGKGIFGALLGAIVGNIPNILALVLFSKTYSLMFALIPLVSYYGYKLLGGKLNNATFWIVSGISIVTAPITDIGTIYFSVIVDYGQALTIADMLSVLGEGWFLGEIAISIFFVILGIIFVRSQITHTSQHEIVDASISLETLSPIL